MNTRSNMVIIKGQIKTSEIMSCVYNTDTRKWDVRFHNGKTYSYAYLNVEKLTQPDVLDPAMYRITREGRELSDLRAIYVFKNEETGEKLLSKRYDKITFVGEDTALAKYLNPSLMNAGENRRDYIPIFPFGCNSSQYKTDASMDVVSHFPLNMLIKDLSPLDERECQYAMNPATHLDFLIYNRISKKPVLAIEVDGYRYHREDTEQASRDLLKNHIMELYGIPLLRLKTNGSGERERIIEMLDKNLIA